MLTLVIPQADVTDRGLLALASSRRLPSLRSVDAMGVGLRIRPETQNVLRQRFDHLQLHC